MSYAKIKQFLLGNPLESQQEHHEKLSITLAITVFAADALSSTAFATEEILIAVSASAFAGFTHLLSLPVASHPSIDYHCVSVLSSGSQGLPGEWWNLCRLQKRYKNHGTNGVVISH